MPSVLCKALLCYTTRTTIRADSVGGWCCTLICTVQKVATERGYNGILAKVYTGTKQLLCLINNYVSCCVLECWFLMMLMDKRVTMIAIKTMMVMKMITWWWQWWWCRRKLYSGQKARAGQQAMISQLFVLLEIVSVHWSNALCLAIREILNWLLYLQGSHPPPPPPMKPSELFYSKMTPALKEKVYGYKKYCSL